MKLISKIIVSCLVGLAAVFAVHSSDPENGCQYINHYDGGITPRLHPNGQQVCKAVQP